MVSESEIEEEIVQATPKRWTTVKRSRLLGKISVNPKS